MNLAVVQRVRRYNTPTSGTLVLLNGETAATLPLTLVDTTLPATPGSIITVHSGGDFQAALNTAALGDVIELDSGATFTGNYTLPNKGAGTSWITIRPNNWASLPAVGTRMLPATAASLSLPKIISATSDPAIQSNQSAHHYRFIGLEIGTTFDGNFALVAMGALTQTQLSHEPHHIVIDRCYIHGNATFALRRCVSMNCAYGAVIDSTLKDAHETGADTQAICCWSGSGPHKIQNNYLEAAGENVIYGGADPSITNQTASDIEIRGNHFFKPHSTYVAAGWSVKNLLEIKHAQRVLIENNVMNGSWSGAQEGSAIALKTVNQNGSDTWAITQDITVRFNSITNVGAGFNVADAPDNANTVGGHTSRLTIHDNLVTVINAGTYNGSGNGLLLLSDTNPIDVIFAHNTLISPTNAFVSFGPYPSTGSTRTSIRDNIADGGLYGIIGDTVGLGLAATNYFIPGGICSKNAIIGASGSYPPNNFFPANIAAVGFTNAGAGDYSLTIGSTYHNASNDSRDLGPNITLLNTRIAGVV